MSSNAFAGPLHLELRPSTRLALALIAVHLAAIIATWLTAIPLAVRVLLTVAMLASMLRTLGHHTLLRARSAVHRLEWSADGRWHLHTHASVATAQLQADSSVLPGLVVLNFRVGGRRRTVLVSGDAVSADAFRRLRARLRLAGDAPTTDASA